MEQDNQSTLALAHSTPDLPNCVGRVVQSALGLTSIGFPAETIFGLGQSFSPSFSTYGTSVGVQQASYSSLLFSHPKAAILHGCAARIFGTCNT